MIYKPLRKIPLGEDLGAHLERAEEARRAATLSLLSAAWDMVHDSQYGEGFPVHEIRKARAAAFRAIKRHSIIIQEEF